ncbi:DUF4148 domain-containing protein [Mitsuaria sp. TWR114]|uniref:DUF4148 domain-containing protein n=1 Tax=Mitsuaria sp. TWR114 TaxID=2601731 RepID=UPI000B85E852|nr:DUF4148 domain-containing protein [Mitsuaria sp. TWR114]TXD85673.1 DUF4148 domain-containing protein [Mitsuaria sp. TWR114]
MDDAECGVRCHEPRGTAMNTLTKTALIAAAFLSASATFAAEPVEKTRAEVIAELQAARDSGEVAALSAEQAGVGALNNGINAPTATQLAAKASAQKTAAKKGASNEGNAAK